MPNIKMLHDFKDPSNPQGRSYKEVNSSKKHSIPIGTLVELKDGVRLWVVAHTRDCDQTPLYELCAYKEEQVNNSFRNPKWHGGYAEESLTPAAQWHERPCYVGLWWSYQKQAYREAFEDGLGTLLVSAPENVKGWHYGVEEGGGWWGPIRCPENPHQLPTRLKESIK